MLKNPHNNLLFDHIDRIESYTIILVAILSFFPLLHNLTQTGSGKEEAHEHMQTEFGNTTGPPK